MTEKPWKEHLEWCKTRALEYLDRGDLQNAVASMTSDLGKHPSGGVNSALMALGVMEVINHNEAGVRRWIEGFN